MPNKTIYVSESDLPLYERAQELTGGNLSQAITRGLKRLVELEEDPGVLAGHLGVVGAVGRHVPEVPEPVHHLLG